MRMLGLMTTYMYPIQPTEKFFGGIYFDNPRTEEEIANVAEIIKKGNTADGEPFPEYTR